MSENNRDFPPPSAAERAPDVPPSSPAAPTPQQPVAPAPRQRKEGVFAKGFGLGAGLALGFGAVAAVGSVLMLIAAMLAGLALVSTGETKASTSLTTIWGGGTQKLRAITVAGPILADASDGSLLMSGSFGYEIAAQLDALSADDASGVVLLVNTPGGSIAGSKAISDAVVRYQERTGHKVLVHVSSMSASGGVYATASADEIVADHGALVGSIGVIFGPFAQYDGVTATTGTFLESGVTTTGGITSEYLSEGTGKDFGNPYRTITPAEREHYQTGLANEYDNFVAHVAQYRGIPAETIRGRLGAHLFDTKRAQEAGLIDAVLGRDEFFRHAAEAAGLDPANTRVEAVRPPSGWEALFGATRAYGHAPGVTQAAGTVPVLSPTFCGATQPLVFAGDLPSVCG